MGGAGGGDTGDGADWTVAIAEALAEFAVGGTLSVTVMLLPISSDGAGESVVKCVFTPVSVTTRASVPK